MVAGSKCLPPEIATLECQKVLHPWTKSCLRAYLSMYVSSTLGSAGYFAVFYLFDCLLRAFKKKKQYELKNLLKNYIRSNLLFSSLVASSFIGVSCSLRRILGKFYTYSLVFIPGTIAGLAISNENQKNQDFIPTAFANMALESLFNKFKDSSKLKLNSNQRVFIFMLLTSVLSYLYSESKNENRYFWFYIPPKTDFSENNYCFHNKTCIQTILNDFAKYFSTGFFLKLLKLIFSNFKRPKVILLSLFQPETYSFAAFFGLYAVIYQIIRCILYKKCRRYTPFHDLISGFISGATYKLETNISIFNSALITLFQIIVEIGGRKKVLPCLPYNVLMFAVSCGLLFHTRLFTPHHCPPIIHYILSTITNKSCDSMVCNYYELLNSCKY